MDPKFVAHIAESGLAPGDLRARELTHVELGACKISNTHVTGYVIPYFDIDGDPLPFYRVRLFDYQHKYKQPYKSVAHVYFPPGLMACIKNSDRDCLIITEGERKAAASVKAGIPAIGLGGVDSWRNRTLILPEETKLETGKVGGNKVLIAKVPAKQYGIQQLTDTVAQGFEELIDLLLTRGLQAIITYDTDLPEAPFVKSQVQRACNTLAHELVSRGIRTEHVRHLILPPDPSGKVGLDDYIIKHGVEELHKRLEEILDARVAFPRHPSPKELVSNALNRGKVGRKEMMMLTRNVITEMDCRGIRMIDEHSRVPYYFDEATRTLMSAKLLDRTTALHTTLFGSHLHREYSVSAADASFISRLAPLYGTEKPIETVSPMRVLTSKKDRVILQLSDSEMVIVTDDEVQPIQIVGNGHDGVLFEQDQVDAVDSAKVLEEFQKQIKEPFVPWWREVTDTVNMTGEHSRDLATLLFYISPWLRRWRGTQLPVEIVCGEAGSGKSSLFTLRLQILTGRPLLRNIPSDIRDWHAGVGSTGGLHVIDNVQFTNKALRQQLSDEICRIITEPHPHVEMRSLYTTAGLHTMPVHSVFAFTAIDQPFHNADLLQRSAVFTVEAIKEGELLGDWATTHLEAHGGREAWIAHHLVALHKFLVMAKDNWRSQQGASHRLAHYQQSLKMMGEICGIDTSWLATLLAETVTELVSDSDWTLQGIQEYAAYARENNVKEFIAREFTSWSKQEEDFASNGLLTTPKRLGRYFSTHKRLIEKTCGITVAPYKRQNAICYLVQKDF